MGCFLLRSLRDLDRSPQTQVQTVEMRIAVSFTNVCETNATCRRWAHCRRKCTRSTQWCLALGDMLTVGYKWLCQKILHYWSFEDPDCFLWILFNSTASLINFEYLYRDIWLYERNLVKTIKWIFWVTWKSPASCKSWFNGPSEVTRDLVSGCLQCWLLP